VGLPFSGFVHIPIEDDVLGCDIDALLSHDVCRREVSRTGGDIDSAKDLLSHIKTKIFTSPMYADIQSLKQTI
jgi:hypothetical protein